MNSYNDYIFFNISKNNSRYKDEFEDELNNMDKLNKSFLNKSVLI